MQTLVAVLRADGSIKFLRRDGDVTGYGERRRAIENSASKLGAEVAHMALIPNRPAAARPTEAHVTNVSDAVTRPELLTDEQVFALHAMMSESFWRARRDAAAAQRSRPSYAPKGRETASERGTAAVRAAAARSLSILEAEALGRGLWS